MRTTRSCPASARTRWASEIVTDSERCSMLAGTGSPASLTETASTVARDGSAYAISFTANSPDKTCQRRVYPGFLARFSPYFVSYAGCGRDARDPRGICNNLGCNPLTGRNPEHWRELPDDWRLRPGRWVWPHLADNQLACTPQKSWIHPSGFFVLQEARSCYNGGDHSNY